MAELKTQPTRKSVRRYISQLENPVRRQDCEKLLDEMTRVTGESPVLWGDSIVGFGRYHYRQKSGQKAIWPLTGFSPRKQNLTIYIMPGFGKYAALLSRLGKHKHSVSCLYVNKLADINMDVLSELIADSVKVMKQRYCENQS
mgnify:CR=1 FL=1